MLASLRLRYEFTGNDWQDQAPFFHGISDGIIRTDAMIDARYHDEVFPQNHGIKIS